MFRTYGGGGGESIYGGGLKYFCIQSGVGGC